MSSGNRQQRSPLQMMTGQHLEQTEMTDMSLVFAR